MNQDDTQPYARAADTLVLGPDVTAFVEEVRRRLADLDEETREELVGGLEADLADQVADGTPLGDPAAYAAELREAAGFPARHRPTLPRVELSAAGLLDHPRERFFEIVARPRIRPVWEILASLRPVWWVARAWVAATAVDVALGEWEQITLVPSLIVPGAGPALLAAAIVVSTLIGLGRLWPGSGPERSTYRRVVVLAGNVVALAIPLTWGLPWPASVGHDTAGQYVDSYDAGWRDRDRQPGIFADGRRVTQIYAYDSAGKPIDVVQLVDQDGQPLSLRPQAMTTGRGAERTVGCTAHNGDTAVANAFPFGQAQVRRGSCADAEDVTVEQPAHPLATVPPIVTAWAVEAEAVKVPARKQR
ncbi:hypothetical protein FXB39_12285 [Nocardioides sp. BGMRC 2183]|nr:hypothetical protein FXB39_12285 [Nocardioides sp. BGMRC 2183]